MKRPVASSAALARLGGDHAAADVVADGPAVVVQRLLGAAGAGTGEVLAGRAALAQAGVVILGPAGRERAAAVALLLHHALVELVERVEDEAVDGQLDQTKHGETSIASFRFAVELPIASD